MASTSDERFFDEAKHTAMCNEFAGHHVTHSNRITDMINSYTNYRDYVLGKDADWSDTKTCLVLFHRDNVLHAETAHHMLKSRSIHSQRDLDNTIERLKRDIKGVAYSTQFWKAAAEFDKEKAVELDQKATDYSLAIMEWMEGRTDHLAITARTHRSDGSVYVKESHGEDAYRRYCMHEQSEFHLRKRVLEGVIHVDAKRNKRKRGSGD